MEDRVAARPGVTVGRGHARGSRRSSPAALFAAILLCLNLAACGGSAKSATSAGAGTTGSTATTTATTSTAATTTTAGGSSGGGDSASGATLANPIPTGDQDGDSSDETAFDKDDGFITTFGHAADPSDRKTITNLVKNYYSAIAAADGAKACSLLFFVIVESAAETYGQTATNATAGRGKTCGAVMSKVFAATHRQLVAENSHLKVIAIRVQAKRAWVLLRFGPASVRRLVVYREGDTWKVGELLDTELV